MNKSPAFQFYPKDWRDYKVLRMSYKSQGVYWRLLGHIWTDTPTQYSIKNDTEMLRKILALPKKEFSLVWKEIQWGEDKIFVEKNGNLISKRLQVEKQKQRKLSKKRREAAKARWNKENTDTTCNANAKQTVCLTTASSIASASAYKETKEEETPPPSLSDKFIKIVSLYPEFILKQSEDTQWFKNQIESNPKFKGLDIEYELGGWGSWLESQHRLKEKKKKNQFPKLDFKQSLKNRLINGLKYKKTDGEDWEAEEARQAKESYKKIQDEALL